MKFFHPIHIPSEKAPRAFSSAFRIFPALLVLGLLTPRLSPAQTGIELTRHNLLPAAPSPLPPEEQQQLCNICHIPHQDHGAVPLWNPNDSGAAYVPYNSPAVKALPGQPSGASKVCLSCHDGAIATGDLANIPPDEAAPAAVGNQHPVSVPYPASPAGLKFHLAPTSAWDPRVQLDNTSRVQCITCHEPHDDRFGNFLAMDNRGAALCRVCHTYNDFPQTAHATSAAAWNGKGVSPWPHTNYRDVRSNACLNCHTPHHAADGATLPTRTPEEAVCFTCHNGSVAAFNLEAVFMKPYHHPVESAQGVHRDGESPLLKGDHVECADCHNPHRAHRGAPTSPPFVKGTMRGVTGVDTNGLPLSEALFEYQVCFKCHAYASRPPLDAVSRRIPSFNLLRDFAPSAPSFHPVEAPGRNRNVPSLILPLTPASMIYCTDCHNNDKVQPRVPGAPGSTGPHGSSYQYLLVAQYRTGDAITESPTAYALCYNCHSRHSILANQSFPLHRLHIVDQHAPCSVCHDAHGIDPGQGNTTNNAHLINFDATVVRPDAFTKRLEYRTLGTRKGQCFLNCHGVNHSPFQY